MQEATVIDGELNGTTCGSNSFSSGLFYLLAVYHPWKRYRDKDDTMKLHVPYSNCTCCTCGQALGLILWSTGYEKRGFWFDPIAIISVLSPQP